MLERSNVRHTYILVYLLAEGRDAADSAPYHIVVDTCTEIREHQLMLGSNMHELSVYTEI